MRCLVALMLAVTPVMATAETMGADLPEVATISVTPEDIMELRIAADFLDEKALYIMGAEGGRRNAADRFLAAQALSDASDAIAEAALALEEKYAAIKTAHATGMSSMQSTAASVDQAALDALNTLYSVRPIGAEFQAGLVASVSQLDELRTMMARMRAEQVEDRTICVSTPGVTGRLFERDVSDGISEYVLSEVARGQPMNVVYDPEAGRARIRAEFTGGDIDTDIALIVFSLNEILSASVNFRNLDGAMQIVTSKDDSLCPVEPLS